MADPGTVGLGYFKHGQRHCGIFFETENDGVRMLHLATDRQLRIQPSSKYFLEVPASKIAEQQKLAISNLCRILFKRYANGLRYSPTIEQHLDDDYNLIISTAGAGFTCATFVAESFMLVGAPLVDIATWPNRNSVDFRWLTDLVALLVKTFGDDLHFAAIKPNSSWRRLKPEEITAAADVAPPAIAYSTLRPKAKRLNVRLEKSFPPISNEVAI